MLSEQAHSPGGKIGPWDRHSQTDLQYVQWLQGSISVLRIQLVIKALLADVITDWWMWKMCHLVKSEKRAYFLFFYQRWDYRVWNDGKMIYLLEKYGIWEKESWLDSQQERAGIITKLLIDYLIKIQVNIIGCVKKYQDTRESMVHFWYIEYLLWLKYGVKVSWFVFHT